MSRHHILIIVSPRRYSQALITQAIDAAAEHPDPAQVDIDLLYIFDEKSLSDVSRKVRGDGFLGPAAQDDVLSALDRDHHRIARRRIGRAKKALGRAGYSPKVTEVTGQFVEEALRYADEVSADLILLVRAERSQISRILFGSAADRLARLAREAGGPEVIIARP